MEPDIQFCLLGPLQVRRDGASLSLGGRQQRAVLGRLLVEADRVVPLERLADALWGERVPDGFVTTIQTYVSHLRDVLEHDRPRAGPPRILVTQNGGYRLRVEGDAVDAVVFERHASTGRALLDRGRYAEAAAELAAALSLWRGHVLEDLADYDFAREEAARLEEVRLEATEARIEADLALGRHGQLTTELGTLVAAHPLRERLHAQRMLVLYRCGQQAAALATYRNLRDMLAEELGIDPTRAIQRLHEAILRQDPALDWRRSGPAGPLSGTADLENGLLLSQSGSPGVTGVSRTRKLVTSAAVVAVAAAVSVSTLSADSAGRPQPPLLDVLPANSVGRVDAAGGLRAAVSVEQSPTAVAVGANALWAANQGAATVSRIDPVDGRVVQSIPVGPAPNAITITGDSVWVVNGGNGTVSRINAGNDRVVQTVQVGNIPTAIASGPRGIWVTNSGDDTIQRIDPRSGSPGLPVAVGGQPAGVAVQDRTVWVTNGEDATVPRIDAVTGQAQSPIPVGAGPSGIAVTADSVWVASSLEQSLYRIDRATGRVVHTIEVGDGPHSVLASGGAVWVSNEYDGTLVRIDPASNKITRRVAIGSSPRGLAFAGSSLWVASSGGISNAHRGGTLTVEGRPVPGFDTIDPAYTYTPGSFAMVYDGLVTQRRTGGADGTTLVPDLAIALPRPTDGGREYTFTVRRGIRYSTGTELTVGDIKRGLLRALAVHSAYFYGVVGARACAADPKECAALDRGVVVDDSASTITFRLLAPDPDFIAKLASHVFAIAPGVPPGEPKTPVPATGPYMIAGFTQEHRREAFTLVRNPYFRQWSFAARPDGYPDVIRWRRSFSATERAADVLAGRADLSDPAFGGFPSDVVADLALEHASLLHSDPIMATAYEWLNTRIPPFDDVNVRKALNLAVDRDRIVALKGGASTATASCQVLPPNFPGYQPYCPYTLNPQPDGAYHGPDLATATELVRASGTKGMSVAVWADDADDAVSRYFVSVLRTLGYRASLKVDSEGQRSDSRRAAQMGSAWWGADFPTLSNFWGPLLSCGSFVPANPQNLNSGGFCDRSVDALARRALDLQVSDPAAARKLWTVVDHRITDEAPWVAGPVTLAYALTSPRVGNYQSNPVLGPLIDQMWVR